MVKRFFSKLATDDDANAKEDSCIYKPKSGWEITLIGHSMGAIVASEIVGAFPDLPYRNVVFIGAAVSVREFENTVLSALATTKAMGENEDAPCIREKVEAPGVRATANKSFCFFNLSLHPYAEATEENFLGAAPSGSLLEWIDGNFENPADLTDRTVGRWANVAPLRRYFERKPVGPLCFLQAFRPRLP